MMLSSWWTWTSILSWPPRKAGIFGEQRWGSAKPCHVEKVSIPKWRIVSFDKPRRSKPRGLTKIFCRSCVPIKERGSFKVLRQGTSSCVKGEFQGRNSVNIGNFSSIPVTILCRMISRVNSQNFKARNWFLEEIGWFQWPKFWGVFCQKDERRTFRTRNLRRNSKK